MRMRGPLLSLMALALVPAVAAAQDGFLFSKPVVQATFRAGPVIHRAQSDVFDLMTSELTLDRGDFRAPAIQGDLAFTIHDRVDLVVGASWSKTESNSESRNWVGSDDLPIEQTTRFSNTGLTLSGRFYPLERGERVSDLAWVPARTQPYVGAGGGLGWYRLQQVGEFVEETGPQEGAIFEDEFTSSGSGFTAHVLAGTTHWLTGRVGVNVEGRYTWGSAELGGDWSSGPGGRWEDIDLSGFQAGVGLSVRW